MELAHAQKSVETLKKELEKVKCEQEETETDLSGLEVQFKNTQEVLARKTKLSE